MSSFHLKIVTPDGVQFDGQAELLTVRTTSGDMGIMAGHVNCVAPMGMGQATVVTDGKKRFGACIGGILSVMNGEVNLVPTTFEWAEDIDAERAANAAERARKILDDKNRSKIDLRLAQARLRRALVRQSVAQHHT